MVTFQYNFIKYLWPSASGFTVYDARVVGKR